MNAELNDAERDHVANNRTIDAMRLYRIRTGASLPEAYEAVMGRPFGETDVTRAIKAERARLLGVVEGMRVSHRDGCDLCRAYPPGHCINESRAVFGNTVVDAVLAVLRGGAP